MDIYNEKKYFNFLIDFLHFYVNVNNKENSLEIRQWLMRN